jgi:hypothetical protein
VQVVKLDAGNCVNDGGDAFVRWRSWSEGRQTRFDLRPEGADPGRVDLPD